MSCSKASTILKTAYLLQVLLLGAGKAHETVRLSSEVGSDFGLWIEARILALLICGTSSIRFALTFHRLLFEFGGIIVNWLVRNCHERTVLGPQHQCVHAQGMGPPMETQ